MRMYVLAGLPILALLILCVAIFAGPCQPAPSPTDEQHVGEASVLTAGAVHRGELEVAQNASPPLARPPAGRPARGPGNAAAAGADVEALSPADAAAPVGPVVVPAEPPSLEVVGDSDVVVVPPRRQRLIASLTIFTLAVFVGFEIINKVPPTLHTPLMSGSNAISGITLVGAVIVASRFFGFSSLMGLVAVALAMVNVVGGFLVTHRMLAMFKKKK